MDACSEGSYQCPLGLDGSEEVRSTMLSSSHSSNDLRIEDPFLGFNELKCEWVNETAWTYKVSLPSVPAANKGTKHVLAFDGLDTFANVKVNGKTVLESDNMFIMHRVDVTDVLQPEKENVLEIDFKSAMVEARKIKDAHPEHKWVGFNGDMARLAVRKAQYHWGWDWGPVLSPCGPWRAVRLETYHARVEDLRIDYEVDDSFKKVTGTIAAFIEGQSGKTVEFSGTLDGKGAFKATAEVQSNGQAKVEFHINEPKLWYPHGYGEQPLYDVTATITTGEHSLDSMTKRTGFRKGELIQEPDEIGKTFYFRFNGIDVFCGGSDWIPADSFTPRITKEKYRKWLEMMVDGYQVMIRVWGGGIWEEDVFYELCDELGVLCWQDAMFGCGSYPCFPEMLKSIEEECVCQMKRLRHHPSIAIYAGNNEDYQVQEQMGLTYSYEDKDPQSWLKTDFPARYIYEKVCSICSLEAHRTDSCLAPSRCCRSTHASRTLPSWLTLG